MAPRLPAKLLPRRAAGALQRQRLHAALQAPAAALLWVHGPAGAGKTTLVAAWLAQQRLPALWYRVDASDADPATFFAWLGQGGAALTRRRGVAWPLLTPEYLPDLPGFARRFFRQLGQALPARAVLVLDAAESAGAALPPLLSVALDELGPQQRIVITSRDAPPAALMPLRAKNEMALLAWPDLRLTTEEAHALAAPLGLDDAQAEALRQDCDGWMAGYTLLLNARRRGIAPDAALLREELFPFYLSELFQRAEPGMQALLMRCALLPAFSAAQAQALAPEVDAEALLQALRRRNFFLECSDGATPVWRLHALFREFLLLQAGERIAAPALQALRRQAAGLLAEDGRPEEALPLLRQAGAWDEAVKLTLALAPGWLALGRFAAVESAILALPQRAPWLDFWLGMARLPVAPPAARQALEQAYRQFRADDDRMAALQCCAAILDCHFMELSVSPDIDRWGDAVLELLPPDLQPPTELRVLSSTTVLYARADRHVALLRHARQRLQLLLEDPCDAGQGVAAMHFLCMGSVWRGDWAGVRHLLDRVGLGANLAALPLMQRLTWMSATVIEAAWAGRFTQAMESVDRLEQEAHANGIVMLDNVLAGYRAYIAANAGLVETMADSVARMSGTMRPESALEAANVDMQASVLAMMQGEPMRAHAAQQQSIHRCEAVGATMFAEVARLMQAQGAVQMGELDQAEQACERSDDFGRRAEMPAFCHTAGWIRAWIAWRRGQGEAAAELLRPVLTQGRALGFKVVFPWLPPVLLQELAPVALDHGIEPDHLCELLRLRQIAPPAHGPENWPWPLRIRTLGRFELVLHDQPWQPPPKTPKKPLELLKALVALGGGEAVATLTLQQALWPDLDGAAAQNAFHVALHRLRRLLGDEQALHLVDGRLQPDARRVWLDVQALQRLAEPPALPAGERAQRLLALYRGSFLDDEDMPWAVPARRRWHGAWLRGCARAGDELAGDAARADFWQQVVERDPGAEPAHQALIVALLAQGRCAEARQALQACDELLRQLTGQGPSPRTLALLASVHDR